MSNTDFKATESSDKPGRKTGHISKAMTAFPNSSTVARKIWALLTSAERRSATVLLGLILVGMVVETFSIGLVIPAIALVTRPHYVEHFPALQRLLGSLGSPSQRTLVVVAMLGLVSVYALKALYLAFLAWQQARFAFGIQAQTSQRLFSIYLHQPYTFHLQRNSAQLLRNVIGDVSIFANGAVLPGLTMLTEASVVLGLCILLLVAEPLGALIVVGILGSAAWGLHRFTRHRIARWGLARQHHEGLRIQHLQQGLGGAKDVKLLGREAEFLGRYHLHNAQSARVARLQHTLQQLPRLGLELLAVCALAALVLTMLIRGRALEAVLPTLGLFATAAFRLMFSISRALNSVQSLRYALPVVHTLYEEMKLATPADVGTHAPRTPFREAVSLEDVTYTYPGAPSLALKDVTLRVNRGESVGFIGESGAGKSTLVDILLGLLTPDSGRVMVDGEDIQQNLRNWQDQIGYVPQSIFLTDDTLRRNVAFGLPDDQIDDEAVRRAIRAAQLEEFVNDLPHGLATPLGERGVRLSGGQRQRIGIARALYHDPAVLVLDEATSSLDTATEYGVMQAVRALRGNKTIIIVTHRLTTVEHCDRLYRLKKGRVVEQTHRVHSRAGRAGG